MPIRFCGFWRVETAATSSISRISGGALKRVLTGPQSRPDHGPANIGGRFGQEIFIQPRAADTFEQAG